MNNEPEILAPHPDDKSPLLDAATKGRAKPQTTWVDVAARKAA